MASLAPAAGAAAAPATSGPEVAPGVHLAAGSSAKVEGGSVRGASKAAAEREPRIVGGQAVDISQVPHQVAITVSPALFEGDALTRQFCGGTLVAPTVVITAAHCVFNEEGTAIGFTPDELAVVTGRTVLTSNQGQELPVSNFFVFIDGQGRFLYDAETGAWDVAVIQLGQASTTGTPIQLPGADERELWSNGRAGLVSGWGNTRFRGEKSDQLLATEIYMTRESRCELAFGGAQFFDEETSICAGVFPGGRDACQGDSGGPFVVPSAQGVVRLAGNVQSGVGCGERNSPGAYGRFGEGAVQQSLRNAALQIAGTEIVGSGLTPPTAISVAQAQDISSVHAQEACERSRKCRRARADKCQPEGTGVKCRERLFNKSRRGKKTTCTENYVHDASGGTIASRRVGGRTCKKGW